MNHIKFSVGQGGANDPQDVGIVQHLLNVVKKRDREEPLVVDGIAGPKTIAAIRKFQQKNRKTVDGRLDPGGESIQSLNQLAPQIQANDGVAFLTTKGGDRFA